MYGPPAVALISPFHITWIPQDSKLLKREPNFGCSKARREVNPGLCCRQANILFNIFLIGFTNVLFVLFGCWFYGPVCCVARGCTGLHSVYSVFTCSTYIIYTMWHNADLSSDGKNAYIFTRKSGHKETVQNQGSVGGGITGLISRTDK